MPLAERVRPAMVEEVLPRLPSSLSPSITVVPSGAIRSRKLSTEALAVKEVITAA